MTTPRTLIQKVSQRSRQELRRWRDNSTIRRMARQIGRQAHPKPETSPVLFFKASCGITDFTYNSAFNLLAAWGLRLQGIPVVHLACQAGMLHCVLGTDRKNPKTPPPCRTCLRHSRAQYADADVRWFNYSLDPSLTPEILQNLDLQELAGYEFQHTLPGIPSPVPLGKLVTPGLRWILRRHHLLDDEPTRYLYREYILSAWNILRQCARLLDQIHPSAVIVFNGQFYPEASVRWLAKERGYRCITHEVGLQPFSGYFTEGEATAYPIHIPEEFELDASQNARLDSYLEKRFRGQFSMAGIRFWQDMKGLDEVFLEKAAGFKQIVPVFTNVIFDTSQPHANTVFTDMFEWLGMVVGLTRAHPETLFVIRAHPDETRPGKESQETVQDWIRAQAVSDLPNVIFVGPQEYFSSYELIGRSKFVMIYNSTIGLEASILGIPVLSAGRARFTQYPTVFFPPTVQKYQEQAEAFLASRRIEVPKEFQRNARRFLYYQLFRTSLPFDAYLTTSDHPSLTQFRKFTWQQLLPQQSPAIAAISKGVLENGDFLLGE